jgi:small subunit ribosomal protein S20
MLPHDRHFGRLVGPFCNDGLPAVPPAVAGGFTLWEIGGPAGNLNSRCPTPGALASPSPGGPDIPAEKVRRNLRVANIKSQEKRIRTNERARLRNQSVKSSLRTAVRGFREAVDAGDKEQAAALLQVTSRKLDKAASKGVIHKNQAANKKSALALALNKI